MCIYKCCSQKLKFPFLWDKCLRVQFTGFYHIEVVCLILYESTHTVFRIVVLFTFWPSHTLKAQFLCIPINVWCHHYFILIISIDVGLFSISWWLIICYCILFIRIIILMWVCNKFRGAHDCGQAGSPEKDIRSSFSQAFPFVPPPSSPNMIWRFIISYDCSALG